MEIRRCGKSYLLNNLFYTHLISEGVDEAHIIKFAFDSSVDLGLIGESELQIEKQKRKVDPQKFTNYISSKIIDNKMYYLILDDIQKIGEYETALNYYIRKIILVSDATLIKCKRWGIYGIKH